MKLMTFAATAASLLAFSGAAFAAPPSPSPAPVAKTADLVCPVTGEKIASIKDAAGSSVYKGKTYYFCCGGCKPMFDKTPAKYVKEAVKPVKKTAKATPAPKKA
jgi:Cu+-exporting ATPase